MAPWLSLPLNLLSVGALLTAIAACGIRVLPRAIDTTSLAARWLIGAGFGLWLFSAAMLGLLFLGLLKTPFVYGVIFLVVTIGYPALQTPSWTLRTLTPLECVSLIILFLTAISYLIFGYAPALTNDELGYQLSLPVLYAHLGKLIETPDNFCSYYPLGAQVFYTAIVLLHDLLAVKVTVWYTGLLVAGALYLYARQAIRLERPVACLAVVLMYTTPYMASSNGIVSSDLWGLFYLLLTLLVYERWRQNGALSLVVLMGLFAGAGLGVRPYAGAWVVTIILMLLIFDRNWKAALIMSAVAGVVVAPWFLRTTLLTGNPFYPKAFWAGAAEDSFFKAVTGIHDQLSLRYYVMLPLYISFGPFMWGSGILPVAFAPFAAWDAPRRQRYGRLLFLVLGILFFTSLFPLKYSRYYGQAYPFLAILAAAGIFAALNRLPSWARPALCAVVALFLLVPNLTLAAAFAVKRLPFLTGKQAAWDYVLAGTDSPTALAPYVKASLPKGSRILCVGSSFAQTLYFYPDHALLGMSQYSLATYQAPEPQLYHRMRKDGIGYLLVWGFCFNRDASGDYWLQGLQDVTFRIPNPDRSPYLKRLHQERDSVLYELKDLTSHAAS